MEWRDKFTPAVLKQGEDYFRNNRVADFEKTETGFKGYVQDSHGYQVTILVKDDEIRSMRCGCPVAKGQGRCKHMAAVLYAAENRKEEAAGEGAKAEEADVPVEEEEAYEDDSYRYFDADRLLTDMGLKAADIKKGRALLKKDCMEFGPVTICYARQTTEQLGQMVATVKEGNGAYQTFLTFSRDEILDKKCQCPACYGMYYGWYAREKNCEHISALALHLAEYLKTHNAGDATDRPAYGLIRSYQRKRAAGYVAKENLQPKTMLVRPRLQKRYGSLFASFKVGMQGGKLFVIKNLTTFTEHVRNGENAQYGSSTVLNHNIENFTADSRVYVEYIQKIVAEQTEFTNHLYGDNRGYYSDIPEIKQDIALFGRRLDDFFELPQSESVEYEDKTEYTRKKEMLSFREGNPQIRLLIGKAVQEKTGVFEGVSVSCAAPELIRGQNYTYYIDGQKFLRMDPDFAEGVGPLLDQSVGGEVSLLVGRNQMQAFYYTVLPGLMDYVEVEERDTEEIHQYLRPEVRFVFYLDAEDQNVTCRACAVYGKREVSVMDAHPQSGNVLESFRDEFREQEILYAVQKYFSYYNSETDEFHCNDEEDAVYRILCDGIQELMSWGEVQSTNRFRRLNMAQKTKVTVGVSLQSGMLNLEIASEDIPQEELLAVLESYRKKKTYHRLKSGDFLDLEDDTIGMLAELMESMHMKPKEFVAGKMKIPAYRALYLDKMMEEHEHVYATRDRRFKQLIRNFKAVEDSEFEEPESMKKVLRKYQKSGYRWLRTLENCQFGGILADDMGLGKTLQVLAVLLAAKEEGRMETTLVVCPASLVFNWNEEIGRFTPQLRACMVVGTQEERRKLIADYRSYDVLVTSYDLLKRDIASYSDAEFGYEIIDEAQYIKNHTTEAAKAVKLVNSRTRYALTGTPIENRLSELWSIFDYLMPGFLYRYDAFRKEFETQIVKHEDEQAAGRLRRMVSPFILRRLKEDVLKDLPEKMEEVRYSTFGAEQQKLYDAQVVHMRKTIAEQDPEEFAKNKLVILRELTRLRQICCDPSLCFEDYHGGSAKRDACLDLIGSAMEGGHKILLFSQFTSMLEHIETELKERGIRYYVITGATPKEKRVQMVKKFNKDEVPVFLISLKAGGTGLNLTGADVVIHYDPWWNVAVQNQATDRAHRIGQTKKVAVYKLIVKNSIEEKIQKLQESKQNLADQIISGELNQLSGLTQEELLGLLEL